MGALQIIYDAVTTLKTMNVNGDLKAITQSPSAITKKARDAIHVYPVIMSEGVVSSDDDLAFAINGFAEANYAIFTMIAMGLNPVLPSASDPSGKSTNLSKHVLKFHSSESLEAMEDEDVDFVKFHEPSRHDPKLPMEALIPYHFATEVMKKDEDVEVNATVGIKATKLAEKMAKSDPTILEVDVYANGGKAKISVPVAVKAVPQVVTSDEARELFRLLREDKPLVQLTKVLSGELNLIRDIGLQIKRAKTDKERYRRLGRHPFFRKLMESKSKELLSRFTKGDGAIQPTTTIVLTKDEFERGYGVEWKSAKKEVPALLEKLMILGLIIVDTDADIIEAYFYGIENGQYLRAVDLKSDFKGGKVDNEKDMKSLLEQMIRKV